MDDIKVVYVEAILMQNGEVLHLGKTLGYVSERQAKLVESGACKITKGGEPIINIGKNANAA